MPYGFRIRFLAQVGTALDGDVTELAIPLPDAPEPLVLRQHAPGPHSLPIDPVVLTVDGDGFESEQDARDFGAALKVSLAVYSVRHRRGFNLGHDDQKSGIAKSLTDQFREQNGIEVRPVVHGLDVFETNLPVTRFSMSGRASVKKTVSRLPEDLRADFRRWDLQPKLALAIELYNGCQLVADPEVRFLSLVTVVEVLAERGRVHDSAVAALDACILTVDSQSMESAAAQRLKARIGNLKRQSIGEACANLVSASGADAALFARCYDARSELLHEGVSTTTPDLPRQPHVLDNIVHAVLLHSLLDDQHTFTADAASRRR